MVVERIPASDTVYVEDQSKGTKPRGVLIAQNPIFGEFNIFSMTRTYHELLEKAISRSRKQRWPQPKNASIPLDEPPSSFAGPGSLSLILAASRYNVSY